MNTEEKFELVTSILRGEKVSEIAINCTMRIANDLRRQGAVSAFEESVLTALWVMDFSGEFRDAFAKKFHDRHGEEMRKLIDAFFIDKRMKVGEG